MHERVYDEFLAELTRQGRRTCAPTPAPAPQIGPITMPTQLGRDPRATSRTRSPGAAGPCSAAPDAVGERFVQPTILVDVPEDSAAVQEETFGPTLTVARVRDMDEAVARDQRDPLRPRLDGLRQGARHGDRRADPRPGMTAVNGVITFAAIPALPFGGVGDSGFGRIHGADGLKEFTYAKAIARQRFKPMLTLTSFTRTAKAEQQLAQLITMLHGRGSKKNR